MHELELKFQLPAAAVASLKAELRRHNARTIRMRAHYFDTVDFALARHGFALRLRHEGRKWMQTLKAEGESAIHRLEHNVPLRAAAGTTVPKLDVHRHDGTAAGAALEKVLADAGGARLAARYTTEFTRLACDLRLDGALIEAAFDAGVIRARGRKVPLCELELEHKEGATQALFALAQAWSAHGGLWLSTISKSARGVRLARNCVHGPAVKAEKPDVQAEMAGPQFLRAVVQCTLEQVVANASEIASGSTEEEHIHQLRVGLRRLRTALRELGPLDAGINAGWEGVLSRTFSRLGELRDNVTAARAAHPLLEQAHAPKLQWDAKPAVDPIATVRDAAFQRTLIELLAFALQDAGADQAASNAQLLEHVQARLATLHEQVAKAGKEFETLPIAEQHKVRKRLKRLRYLAEFAAPISHHKAAKRYLEHLEPAQDALGKHMDIAVAIERFRKDAEADAQALYSVSFLEAYLANTARDARTALKKVAKARPFWQD